LHGADLAVGQAVFLGDLEEEIQSWVATDSERCRHLDHDGCFRVDGPILGRGFVKRPRRPRAASRATMVFLSFLVTAQLGQLLDVTVDVKPLA
jgi:hypothetical protein